MHSTALQINQKPQPPAMPETSQEQFVPIIKKSIARILETAIGQGAEEGKKLSLDSNRLPFVSLLSNNRSFPPTSRGDSFGNLSHHWPFTSSS